MRKIILAYNVLASFNRHYGKLYMSHALQEFQARGIQPILFPVMNYQPTHIVERSEQIAHRFPELVDNQEKAIVIAHGVTGLDFRYYLSKLGGDQHIQTLITVSTPHQGSFLADSLDQKSVSLQNIEPPIQSICGLYPQSFKELNLKNMMGFNMTVLDAEGVNYYSIGGDRISREISETLIFSQQYIFSNRVKNTPSDNDGIYAIEEVKWGKYIGTLDADHAQLIGLPNKINEDLPYRHVVNFIERKL